MNTYHNLIINHFTRAILVFFLILTFSSCSKGFPETPMVNSLRLNLKKGDTLRVAVYRGVASCEECAETVKSAIEKLGVKYKLDFVGPEELVDITEKNLSKYDIYVQPGGGQDINGAFRSLGQNRVQAIQNYVSNGGNYLGLCMGAYLADANNLGLIKDELDSEVGRPGFPVKNIDDTSVRLTWEGRNEYVFFQDGPFLLSAEGDQMFYKIASYANGDLAAARYSYGKGLVVLTGPHPEANNTWFEKAEIPLDKRPSQDLFKDLIQSFYR
ncbi:BPL-N domain-containing protein [Pedobacter sp. WC2423]|uniref:BPL-N domain-containing protein n=1 Tax=Pedobacter sp. WC2423 TaxID=3234142 RepID=UPI0034666E61